MGPFRALSMGLRSPPAHSSSMSPLESSYPCRPNMSDSATYLSLGQRWLYACYNPTSSLSLSRLPLYCEQSFLRSLYYEDHRDIKGSDDYANPTATRYTLGGKHLRRRSEQYLGVIAEAVGKVRSAYPHSVCHVHELISLC